MHPLSDQQPDNDRTNSVRAELLPDLLIAGLSLAGWLVGSRVFNGSVGASTPDSNQTNPVPAEPFPDLLYGKPVSGGLVGWLFGAFRRIPCLTSTRQ